MPNNKFNKVHSVPNQKVITIHKQPTDENNLFSVHNQEATERGAKDLQKPASFKLYFYLSKNQNTYKTALSSSDFCEWAGCGMTAYNSAVAELEKKGYLIPKTVGSTIYDFYDTPQIINFEDVEEGKPVAGTREEEQKKKGFIF